MIAGVVLDELTDMYSVLVILDRRTGEYVSEVFIKDEGFLWYGVFRYDCQPSLTKLFVDTYALNCKSLRPYKAGQFCDGSITAPVYHLYNQLCCSFNLDPISLYQEAYPDDIFTADQLASAISFAEWQGVEMIAVFEADTIDAVIESLREINAHQLANTLEEKIKW